MLVLYFVFIKSNAHSLFFDFLHDNNHYPLESALTQLFKK